MARYTFHTDFTLTIYRFMLIAATYIFQFIATVMFFFSAITEWVLPLESVLFEYYQTAKTAFIECCVYLKKWFKDAFRFRHEIILEGKVIDEF